MPPHKRAGLVYRAMGFGHKADSILPHMVNLRPFVEGHIHLGLAGVCGEGVGVAEQNFILPHLNKHGREAV